MAQVAVIMYSIHADVCPRPRKLSVKTVYGALKGFIFRLYFLATGLRELGAEAKWVLQALKTRKKQHRDGGRRKTWSALLFIVYTCSWALWQLQTGKSRDLGRCRIGPSRHGCPPGVWGTVPRHEALPLPLHPSSGSSPG